MDTDTIHKFLATCETGSVEDVKRIIDKHQLEKNTLQSYISIIDKEFTRVKDDCNSTPLHYSVNNIEVFKFLITLGADVRTVDECGLSPFVCVSDTSEALMHLVIIVWKL